MDLARLGIRPGDRVMVVGENSIGAIVLMYAASRLDAWAGDDERRLARTNWTPLRVIAAQTRYSIRMEYRRKQMLRRAGAARKPKRSRGLERSRSVSWRRAPFPRRSMRIPPVRLQFSSTRRGLGRPEGE